jgi:hypothetical protein
VFFCFSHHIFAPAALRAARVLRQAGNSPLWLAKMVSGLVRISSL